MEWQEARDELGLTNRRIPLILREIDKPMTVEELAL
jgi:hypothetical protein